jgi:hypothetical protein
MILLQGTSGSDLGIEVKRHALQHFARAEGIELIGEFVEVETAKGADALDRRPQLKAALAAARKHRCHVTHLAAGRDELAKLVDDRQIVACSQFDKPFTSDC